MALNGNNMSNQTTRTVLNIALAAMVLGAVWMVLEVGISESMTLIKDPNEVSQVTNDTFGGDISFDERALVAGAYLTILGPTGFGAISLSAANPKAINTLIRYGPLLIGAIAITSMSTTISEVLSSDYDWNSATSSDGWHAFVLYITGAAVSAGASLLNMNRKA